MKNHYRLWAAAAMLLLAGKLGLAQGGADLTGYFGFGPMEIHKLDWQLLPPIIADINNNGLNDIIVVNNRQSRIDLLLQKSDFDPCAAPRVAAEADNINDIFGREAAWRFRRVDVPLDVAAACLVVADLNNDGRLDLAYTADAKLYVVLQEAPDPNAGGDGLPLPVWRPARRFDVDDTPNALQTIAAGDLTANGRTDLAVRTDRGVHILRQQENGDLAPPRMYASAGERLRAVMIADLDNDGRDDLLVATTDREFPLLVRFQETAGQLGPEVRLPLAAFTTLAVAPLGPGGATGIWAVASRTRRVFVARLETNADEAPAVVTYPLPQTDNADNRDAAVLDVDGNGFIDVVVTDPTRAQFLLFRSQADGRLYGPETFPGLRDMRKLVATPATDGGRPWLAALSIDEKLIGISRYSDGRLSYPDTVAITDEPVAMDVADITGDGRPDLAYISKPPRASTYHLRTVMDFTGPEPRPGPALELSQLNNNPADLRLVDVDNDGFVDVLVLRPFGPIILARQDPNGAGDFHEVVRSDIHDGLVANVRPANLALAPLGADGAPAILLAQRNFARALNFDEQRGWQVIDQYHGDHPRANLTVAVTAPNAEGATDIVAFDAARNRLITLAQQADGTYRPIGDIETPPIDVRRLVVTPLGPAAAPATLLIGPEKLVLVSPTGTDRRLQTIGDYEPERAAMRFADLAIGDLNNDGVPDVALIDSGERHVEIVTFGADAELRRAFRFKVFEAPQRAESEFAMPQARDSAQPRAVAVGDVTNNGRDDLILLVHDRLILYPQD